MCDAPLVRVVLTLPADFSSDVAGTSEDKLTDAADSFKDLLTKPPFTAAVDQPRMQTAVTDPDLVGALAKILDIYALYGIQRDFKRLAESRALMIDDATKAPPLAQALPPERPAAAGARAAAEGPHGRHGDRALLRPVHRGGRRGERPERRGCVPGPVSAARVRHGHRRAPSRREHQARLPARVAGLGRRSKAAFFDHAIEELAEKSTTGNDFHKGGKQVLILSFSLAGQKDPGRIVYKPSSVEIDCRIVGDSTIVNTDKPQGYTQETSLTELINKYNSGRTRRPGFTDCELPTYRILPYNRTSVPDGYGYMHSSSPISRL